MEKLKKIAELLDVKGSILVGNMYDSRRNGWFVHCHQNWSSDIQSEVTEEERIKRVFFNGFVTDLDSALDEIIQKLGGTK